MVISFTLTETEAKKRTDEKITEELPLQDGKKEEEKETFVQVHVDIEKGKVTESEGKYRTMQVN